MINFIVSRKGARRKKKKTGFSEFLFVIIRVNSPWRSFQAKPGSWLIFIFFASRKDAKNMKLFSLYFFIREHSCKFVVIFLTSNFTFQSEIPANNMNPIAIKPVMIMLIPKPCKPSGMSA